jgi:hypothetical protein
MGRPTTHSGEIETENGLVEVGPRLCDNPELQNAFNQFHANTHTHDGVVGEIGPVAPGLHNGQGAELTFAGARSRRSLRYDLRGRRGRRTGPSPSSFFLQ